jgi:NADPH-dependent F420 reductase
LQRLWFGSAVNCIAVEGERTLAKRIGLIGGTGPEGKGLGARFARAGLEVIIGSRSAERGQEAASEVAMLSGGKVRGAANEDAVRQADIVLVTVPYSGMADTLGALVDAVGDKVVVSAVVPLQFSKARVAALDVADGSAAQEAQRILPRARVVGAFQNLSAHHLLDLGHPIDGDVLVCGDDREALDEVMALANLIEGARGVNCGPLANARYIEDITALLLNINRIHKTETHIKIAGV